MAVAPTVIMLGGRGPREFEALRELDARIVYLDRHVPVDCIARVDVPVDVDLDDWDRVHDICAGFRPDAVLTHTEPLLPLMAYLADRLQVPNRPLSESTARNCRDKLRTRDCFRAAGVPSPDAGLATTVEEALELAARLGPLVVLKPRDGAGGLGVRLCVTPDEVRHAAEAILTAGNALPGLVVEQYVDGPEYAVQTITVGGVTEILTVFAQQVTQPPVFVELGYDHPSGLPAESLAELTRVVTEALRALHIDNWISHTQVRLGPTGFQVIEVNARRPGGRLPDMTAAVSGVDMVLAAGELALGRPVTRHAPRATHAAYRSVVFDHPGLIAYNRRPDLKESAVPPIVEIDVPPGHPVLPVQDPNGGVYGRLVTFGESRAEVESQLDDIRRAVGIQVLQLAAVDLSDDHREFKSCC